MTLSTKWVGKDDCAFFGDDCLFKAKPNLAKSNRLGCSIKYTIF